jgi:HD superfamily phosphohydrolase
MPSAPSPEWDIEALLATVEREYHDSGLGDSWPSEKVDVERALRYIGGKIGVTYAADKCKAVAGSRIVIRVEPRVTGPAVALKICRPFEDAAKMVTEEFEIVRQLPAHPNIILILEKFEVPPTPDGRFRFPLPVTLEEYVDGPNLEKWVNREVGGANTAKELLDVAKRLRPIFQQLLEGIRFLHSCHVFHSDVKPENVLVGQASVKLVDFGYSFRLVPGHPPRHGGTQTRVGFTWRYAWPRLRERMVSMTSPNAVIAMQEPDFSFAFADRYAVGRTIEDLTEQLLQKRDKLEERAGRSVGTLKSGFSEDLDYYARYILLVAGRLKGKDSFSDREFPGMITDYPEEVVEAIQYPSLVTSFTVAREDLAKLSIDTLAQLEPEWNLSLDDQIRVGHVNAPFTPRIRALVNHPALTRLAAVSQLGLVAYVYPGARHSRLEHSLGTYSWAARYLESLWAQKGDPLFRCVTDPADIVAASLGALFHDLGQFPHGHDIEDALPGLEGHASRAPTLYHLKFRSPDGEVPSLESVVRAHWGDDVAERVPEFLGAAKSWPPTLSVLWGCISGTIDADKMDFIQRDSTNLGIAYGGGVEADRLILSLRPVVRGPRRRESRGTRALFRGPPLPEQTEASLGVSSKGILPAHSLVVAREHLFERVYWHRAVRAFKAMLASALRRGLTDLSEVEAIVSDAIQQPASLYSWIPTDCFPESLHLAPSDAAMLYKLRSVVKDKAAAYLIEMILRRRPYRPLLDLGPADWSSESDRAMILRAIQPLRSLLSVSPDRFDSIEVARSRLQRSLREGNHLHPSATRKADADLAGEVAILIDIPPERQSQSMLFVSGSGIESDREIDLGILTGGTEHGWLRSAVPRIYVHPDFEAPGISAPALVQLMRRATVDIGRQKAQAPHPEPVTPTSKPAPIKLEDLIPEG